MIRRSINGVFQNSGGLTEAELNALYGRLDGANHPFDFIKIGNTELKQVGNTFELYVNGVLRHSWTTTPVAPDPGTYMGFGAFTYS